MNDLMLKKVETYKYHLKINHPRFIIRFYKSQLLIHSFNSLKILSRLTSTMSVHIPPAISRFVMKFQPTRIVEMRSSYNKKKKKEAE